MATGERKTVLIASNEELDGSVHDALTLAGRCRIFFARGLRRAADLLRFLRVDAVVTPDEDLVEPLQAALAVNQPTTRLIIWHGSWSRLEAVCCSDPRSNDSG